MSIALISLHSAAHLFHSRLTRKLSATQHKNVLGGLVSLRSDGTGGYVPHSDSDKPTRFAALRTNIFNWEEW
ncbi:hypothetical protein, partial [Brucella thiophenivorans]|uniref:hypothetical protein n=1 Tax=Brucella thiophenivorans TaxID=571255 RepID=UPI0035BC5CFC